MSKMLKLKEPKIKHVDSDIVSLLDMEEGKLMDQGSYGQVNLLHKIGNKAHKEALKQMYALTRDQARENSQRFRHEVAVLQALKHPNIIKMKMAVQGPNYLGIIMEFMPFNLRDDLEYLTDTQARSYFSQLTDALCYLHDRRVIHGDLKLDSVLEDRDDVVKLCEFGIAQILPLTSDKPPNGWNGDSKYQPPEVYNSSLVQNAFKMETFSFGILAWAIFFRTHPHPSCDYLGKVTTSKRLKPAHRECLRLLLAHSPEQRATIFEIRDVLTQESQAEAQQPATPSSVDTTRSLSETTDPSSDNNSPSSPHPKEEQAKSWKIPVLIGHQSESDCREERRARAADPEIAYFVEMFKATHNTQPEHELLFSSSDWDYPFSPFLGLDLCWEEK